ncbi:MAG: hypothetical protein HDQ88_05675 [Clostridia bacterium]|nr:hypothetical protein [Clostridia bacterium]
MAECTCADPQAVAQAIKSQSKNIAGEISDTGAYIDETLSGSKANGGSHGKLDRIRFCHWAAPEYGPVGESGWVNAMKAAQIGVAILNAVIQGQIADKQEDLARGYYEQAKYKWNRFSGKYRPLEESILWEASSTPVRSMDCADDRARAQGAVNPSFDYIDKYLASQAKAYRLCPDSTTVRQLAFARNLTLVDTENYNLRDDEWFTDFKNDQRWNRRSNILNLGRNLSSQAMQYGDVARRLMGDVGKIADRAAGSVSQALGYYGSRFDTVYPTSYLMGQPTQLVNLQQRGDPYEPSGATYP